MKTNPLWNNSVDVNVATEEIFFLDEMFSKQDPTTNERRLLDIIERLLVSFAQVTSDMEDLQEMIKKTGGHA